jgi:hypothetical protein
VIGKRILNRSVDLSDGTHLPAGTIVAVPNEAVNNDPENYPDPERFDGYRFVKLRERKEGVTSQYHQFVTSNKTSLNFGYGKHACPGRFFASAEIKMILAYMLLTYDFQLEDGKRPMNIVRGDSVSFFLSYPPLLVVAMRFLWLMNACYSVHLIPKQNCSSRRQLHFAARLRVLHAFHVSSHSPLLYVAFRHSALMQRNLPIQSSVQHVALTMT